MAQFRGTLQGNRTQATQLGSKESGLVVNAAGWQGAVDVSLRHDAEWGDMALVRLTRHVNGAGVFPDAILYDGPIGGREQIRSTVNRDYTLNDTGIIRSPGKFEGEHYSTLWFYSAVLDGCAESLSGDGDGGAVDIVELTPTDHIIFPDLLDGYDAIVFETRSDGFVTASLYTSEMLDALYRDYGHDVERFIETFH